jgi:hypothetical protein
MSRYEERGHFPYRRTWPVRGRRPVDNLFECCVAVYCFMFLVIALYSPSFKESLIFGGLVVSNTIRLVLKGRKRWRQL